MENEVKRIGILTSGGDAPGMNACIRAVVRAALGRGIECVGIRRGWSGLINGDIMTMDNASVSRIINRGGTMLYTARSDEFRTLEGQKKAAATCKLLGLDGIVAIGGDGTFRGAQELSKHGIAVVGIPGTIDEDIVCTEYTIGFDTAANTAVECIDRLRDTMQSHERCAVVEVMGRYAGWIALTAGMSSGADIILIPELDYDIEAILATIKKRVAAGKHFSIIVVSEGIRHPEGHLVSQRTVKNSPDPIRLGGIGPLLAAELEQRSDIEARSVVLGHLQRGGRPNPFDRILATRFGAAAVAALAEGESGKMVALQGKQIVTVPLKTVAGKQKLVPADHELIQIGRSMGICFGS
mgnify:CR=1 FL=1